MRPVVFLSDFGLADPFVGTCHAVLKRTAPGIDVIDLAHGIAPQNVLQGALALHDAAPFLPGDAIVLAVVDPGVGSARRAIAVRGGDRRFYIGPDNGLLLLAAERQGPLYEARELADPRYRLDPVSATFHGRDIFAPAAAHLAAGVPFSELGPTVDPSLLVRLEVPAPVVAPGTLEAQVVAVDTYGNLQLVATVLDLVAAGFVPGAAVEVSSARPTPRTSPSPPPPSAAPSPTSRRERCSCTRTRRAASRSPSPGAPPPPSWATRRATRSRSSAPAAEPPSAAGPRRRWWIPPPPGLRYPFSLAAG